MITIIPEDLPEDLPDEAPSGSPVPWTFQHKENGIVEIYDSTGTLLFTVYAWEQEAYNTLRQKLARINGETDSLFFF